MSMNMSLNTYDTLISLNTTEGSN